MVAIQVVAALLVRLDGDGRKRFLIGRRPPHKAQGLYWEFVGGKTEPGESKEEALRRECREELDVEIAVGEEFCVLTHAYPDSTVELTLFRAEILKGTPKMLEHCGLAWITPEEIPSFAFSPADESILARLPGEI